MEYFIHILIFICIYFIFAQSFNLTFGMGGLFNLSHVASYAIGAYTAALLSTELSAGFWLCIAASIFSAALFSFLLELIAYRLKEDYFAIGTLAFSSVVTAVLINWKNLTRGVLGIPGIPRPEMFGISFIDNRNFLALIACFALAVNILMWFVFRNRFGRTLKAQAEYPQALMALGFDGPAARNKSFFIASAIAGLAGAFFAYYINYIDPSSFMLSEMVYVLTIVLFGRPGSFWGCLGAVVALFVIQESLRFVDLPSSILGPMRQMLYAVILFLIVFFQTCAAFSKTEAYMSEEILSVDNIRFSVAALQILDGVSCRINQKETVGIIGPNGSGKTTFFNCLSGFCRCDSGKIVFRGKDISKTQPFKRAAGGLGRVFQNFGIFREMTVLENIILALESRQRPIETFFPWSKKSKENESKAYEFLSLVGLEGKARDRAASLSGGQMRLLEITRSLAFGADLFLLDEPTSGVSPKMKNEVAGLIKKLQELGKTILVIEHDMDFIQQFCKRILVLDEGKIILDDSPENVRANPMLQEIYFGDGKAD